MSLAMAEVSSASVRAPRRSRLPSDVRDRLESVQDNLEILLRQVKDVNATPTYATPTREINFHAGLLSSARLVSSNCTKMAVLFSKPPAPAVTECGVVCRQLEQATLQLVSTLYRINPDAQGRTLQKEARSNVLDILMNMKKLVGVFIKEGCSSGQLRLRGSGTVWDSCGVMEKLSKDNKMAASKVCLAQLRLLQDAREELRQLQSRKGEAEGDEMEGFEFEGASDLGGVSSQLERATLEEEGQSWCETDMTAVNPCISIVQSVSDFTKATCQQLVTRGGVSTAAELDRVCEEVCPLSPLVDDVVSELPAPINGAQLANLGLALGKQFLQFIDAVDSCSFAHHRSNGPTPHFTPKLYRDVTHSNLAILRDFKPQT